jgi:hypothetical protein
VLDRNHVTHKWKWKVIIYVTNIKLYKDIAEELNCKAYYSSLTKKENILQDF